MVDYLKKKNVLTLNLQEFSHIFNGLLPKDEGYLALRYAGISFVYGSLSEKGFEADKYQQFKAKQSTTWFKF